MSPELIAPQRFGLNKSRPTKASDCYALGMVIYETISGNLPFHKHADLTVAMKVLEGECPPRGTRFTRGLWKMLELCWASQPNNRPSIEDVRQCLEASLNSSEPPSPGVDVGVEDDSDGLDSDNSSLGVPTGVISTMTERSAMPSGTSYSTDYPLREGTNTLGCEVADQGPLIPPIELNDGNTYQVMQSILTYLTSHITHCIGSPRGSGSDRSSWKP